MYYLLANLDKGNHTFICPHPQISHRIISVIPAELRELPAWISSYKTPGLVTAHARISERYYLCGAAILAIKVAEKIPSYFSCL